jgi:DNA polymerase III alpha subunit (gram-positive type)
MTRFIENLVFFDIEASGLDPVQSWPIEIGWAPVKNPSAVGSFLISPVTAPWANSGYWAAEHIHHIPREMLIKEGRSVHAIVEIMQAELAGKTLVANSSYDNDWLRQLFDAANVVRDEDFGFKLSRPFRMENYPGVPAFAVDQMKAEAAALYKPEHRAGPDAQRDAYVLLNLLTHWPKGSGK